MLTEFRIGIDDTDSKTGGCTTYTGTLLFEELVREGFNPIDFPWLVRLNPNIPWKTRGNGAVAISLSISDADIARIKKTALTIVEETTDPSIPLTDPAVVFLRGPRPQILTEFSKRALCDVIHIKEARDVARKSGVEVHVFNRPRGMIGALAAIGTELEDRHTFEIIAYRTEKMLGSPRRIDENSVREMDTQFRESTFNNIDPETGRVLICPHGPDPVLLGIRGLDPVSLPMALKCIRLDEPIERTMIFKTNNGTDAHLDCERLIDSLRPHMAAVVKGAVEKPFRVLRGGHLVFTIRDDTGSIDCAAYEPLGSFRKVVRQLLPGDTVKAFGGIRRGPFGRPTLNLEKIQIDALVPLFRSVNPSCPTCGTRCESMGSAQGFRCRSCKLRFPSASRTRITYERKLSTGIFIPPPRAHRHLTKPLSRLAIEESKRDSILAIQGSEELGKTQRDFSC